MDNYMEVKKGIPSRYRRFIFLDSTDCAAEKAFFRCKVPVKVIETWCRNDQPYHFAVCDVLKKYVDRFKEAMEIHKDNMLILGHTDYQEACLNLFGELLTEMEK